MNPEAPVVENPENYGTECDVANCPFFLKTGACRFGDRYSPFSFPVTQSSVVLTRRRQSSWVLRNMKYHNLLCFFLLKHLDAPESTIIPLRVRR